MTDQEKCIAGICCDCGAKIKPWTLEEIQAVKGDIGMTDDDDFSDICGECFKRYLPF